MREGGVFHASRITHHASERSLSNDGHRAGSNILVVGSAAFDDIETPFGKVEGVLGGSTSYFAAAASLYAPVRVVSVVGTDFPPDAYDFLTARGVDLRGLQRIEGKTFRWGGRYDYDLNVTHTTFTDLNVYADFHPVLPDGYAESNFVFCANIHPTLQREVLSQVRNPRMTMMDTMNLWIDTERKALVETMSMVDMVSINESEVRMLAGTSSVVTGARRIIGMGPTAVLVKKGEYGAVLFTEDEYFVAPAYPLEEVRDPTGAGDSFAGGFMGYLAAHEGEITASVLRKAIIHGSAVASFTVEEFSVERLRRLTRAELEQRYREFRRFTHFDDEVMRDT
jgi:sugar/nucleoside kinase (ribokinase family)